MAEVVFIVPLFVDGQIDGMRAFADVDRAQELLRRHVKFDELLMKARLEYPEANSEFHEMMALGEVERTRYAGSIVYEVEVT